MFVWWDDIFVSNWLNTFGFGSLFGGCMIYEMRDFSTPLAHLALKISVTRQISKILRMIREKIISLSFIPFKICTNQWSIKFSPHYLLSINHQNQIPRILLEPDNYHTNCFNLNYIDSTENSLVQCFTITL